jgi:hypothetical protein
VVPLLLNACESAEPLPLKATTTSVLPAVPLLMFPV